MGNKLVKVDNIPEVIEGLFQDNNLSKIRKYIKSSIIEPADMFEILSYIISFHVSKHTIELFKLTIEYYKKSILTYNIDHNIIINICSRHFNNNESYVYLTKNKKEIQLNLIKYLINTYRIDINKPFIVDNNLISTLLHTVCYNENNIELIKFILQNKPKINETEYLYKRTPLMYLCMRSSYGNADYCIKNHKLSVIYDMIVEHGNIVSLLIENKANVNKIDSNNMSALSYAVLYGHINIVRLLIKAGAKIDNYKMGKLVKKRYVVNRKEIPKSYQHYDIINDGLYYGNDSYMLKIAAIDKIANENYNLISHVLG